MKLASLIYHEIIHRWKTSLLMVILVAVITGTVAFFAVNNRGYQNEVTRNMRDIGSNVVILPPNLNWVQYHMSGGYTDETMPDAVVNQLIEFRASLNHLIPTLEHKAVVSHDSKSCSARIVGLAASIAMPGRPKSPMQRAIDKDKVQVGNELADELGIGREQPATIEINGQKFAVSRVNRENGTWQDAAVLMDLKSAQDLFDLSGQVSRIEAIECTSEKCEQTGLPSDVVLANELAQITDQAVLLRREQIANARTGVRLLSRQNLDLLQNVLWILLALSIVVFSAQNSFQRKSEIGTLQALGYGAGRLVTLFVSRSILLTLLGSLCGITLGAFAAYWQSRDLFLVTGQKFVIDWLAAGIVGVVAIGLAGLSSSLPAMLSASRHPAELIGKEN